MALALRFPEEAEFSSRAGNVVDDEEVAESKALFRWSKSIRQRSNTQSGPLRVEELYVATPGSAQIFLQELTTNWRVAGTLIMTDQAIPICRLDGSSVANCTIFSEQEANDDDFGKRMAVILPHDISASAIWTWVNALEAHIEAKQTFCFDSQISNLYDNSDWREEYPLLRTLATPSVASKVDIPFLEAPRFVSGITAALLTKGQLRKRSVRAFISVRDSNTLTSESVRSFLRAVPFLPAAASSHLAGLDAVTAHDEFNALYT